MLRSSRLVPVALSLVAAACSASPASDGSVVQSDDLTGTSSGERDISFQGAVIVAPTATDAEIQSAIARQVKTAIGALRSTKISLDDRGALHNVDPRAWTRQSVTVVDPAGAAAPRSALRVVYPYKDRAVVTHSLDARSAVSFTMLAGDYASYADALRATCSDDPKTETDSLWFHFDPASSSCQKAITSELSTIAAETTKLGSKPLVIGPTEASRRFLSVTAKLGPVKASVAGASPEYARLFGLGTDKSQVLVYAMFGVDADETNPDDVLAQEWVRFLRTLLASQPNFRVTRTDPQAMLLDVSVDGKKIQNVDYARMFSWILDKTGYPAEVGTDAGKIDRLRRAALANLTERWIDWDLPVKVSDAQKRDKTMTVRVRSYFGYEDGSAQARQRATWRYLEAFWHGDVFLYNGHSHFGHGPLEPTNFSSQNYDDHYQLMMINSCVSYNYYHEDFFAMKPGGTKNLDMIINGSPAYVWGGGTASARLVTGLISGKQPTYTELLTSMQLDTPWGEKGYDPMRVADGEQDNVYSRTTSPMTVTALAPLY